ncbi:MAG: fumarylacetoacetate hydrolase family protein [Acidobacteria bacterium]|nr:fumarylacetoacetate hydrolase family protein [Acidobacteriota bacterium]
MNSKSNDDLISRRELLAGAAASIAIVSVESQAATAVEKYVRFERAGRTAYGRLEGDAVRELTGSFLAGGNPTRVVHPLKSVTLLVPCEAPKIIAVARNYKSHIGNTPPPPRVENFFKPITCLQRHDAPIIYPTDAKNLHYEGELVLVIGKMIRNASREQAREAIWGVTCGNDVSERDWQNGANKDIQWWRAKGADTFGPAGPCVARGLDYGNLMLRTRLNGQVVQEASTKDLIYDCETIVSVTSRYVTLTPGDLIYTGTPGVTKPMKPGDIVEVEIEGVGVLRNRVVAG